MVTINPEAIAAAIDASDALGLAGSSAFADCLSRSRTTDIRIASKLASASGEAKDLGPCWLMEVKARADGAPCLNEVAALGLWSQASGRCQFQDKLVSVTAYWGSHVLAFVQSGTLAIYPPNGTEIEKRRKLAALIEEVMA